MHGHEPRIPELWAPRDALSSWSRFPPRDLLRMAPLRTVMEPPDFGFPAPIPHGGRALQLLPQGYSPRKPSRAPGSCTHIHGLQVLWLRSVSGPSAPCKLLPLPSKRYLCSEEPRLASCSLPEPCRELVQPAWVPPRAREEQQGPAGLGPSAAIPAGRRL